MKKLQSSILDKLGVELEELSTTEQADYIGVKVEMDHISQNYYRY